MLAIWGIVLVCLLAGAGVIYYSIGANAVAKHDLAVKVEQDKRDAVAKVKTEEAAKALIDMQAAYEAGKAEREIVEKKIYVRGETVVRTLPAAARSVDCTIPPAGLAVLNEARAAAMDALGLDSEPVTIRESPKPAAPPKPKPEPEPVSSGRPPKPVPK